MESFGGHDSETLGEYNGLSRNVGVSRLCDSGKAAPARAVPEWSHVHASTCGSGQLSDKVMTKRVCGREAFDEHHRYLSLLDKRGDGHLGTPVQKTPVSSAKAWRTHTLCIEPTCGGHTFPHGVGTSVRPR